MENNYVKSNIDPRILDLTFSVDKVIDAINETLKNLRKTYRNCVPMTSLRGFSKIFYTVNPDKKYPPLNSVSVRDIGDIVNYYEAKYYNNKYSYITKCRLELYRKVFDSFINLLSIDSNTSENTTPKDTIEDSLDKVVSIVDPLVKNQEYLNLYLAASKEDKAAILRSVQRTRKNNRQPLKIKKAA